MSRASSSGCWADLSAAGWRERVLGLWLPSLQLGAVNASSQMDVESFSKFRDGVGGVSITKSRYEAIFMYRGIKRRWNVLSRVLFQNKVSQRHLHKERATQTSLSSHSSQLHLQDGVGRCRFGLHTQNPSYHVLSYCIPKTWFNMQFETIAIQASFVFTGTEFSLWNIALLFMKTTLCYALMNCMCYVFSIHWHVINNNDGLII